jgi:hypothetical protein
VERILVLITAFTIGHSITLALSAFRYGHFNAHLIEVLIPVTILLTALRNLFLKRKVKNSGVLLISFRYVFWIDSWRGVFIVLSNRCWVKRRIFLPLFAFNVGCGDRTGLHCGDHHGD